jgi:hypothetical protein
MGPTVFYACQLYVLYCICVLELESLFLKQKNNTGSTAADQLSPHPF